MNINKIICTHICNNIDKIIPNTPSIIDGIKYYVGNYDDCGYIYIKINGEYVDIGFFREWYVYISLLRSLKKRKNQELI